MTPRISFWLAVMMSLVMSLTAFVLGAGLGFFGRDMIKYDACLDRINYDKNLWHLCDTKPPRAP